MKHWPRLFCLLFFAEVTDAIMVSDGQIFGLILHTAAMKISYQNEDENDTECCFLSLSS